MHGLYVGAHAVNAALQEHGRDLVDAARARGRVVGLSPVMGVDVIALTLPIFASKRFDNRVRRC
jgi:hypothetical protein